MVNEQSKTMWDYARHLQQGGAEKKRWCNQFSVQWWHEHNDDLQLGHVDYGDYGDYDTNLKVFRKLKGAFTGTPAYLIHQRLPCLEMWLKEYDGYVIDYTDEIGKWVKYDPSKKKKNVSMHHAIYENYFTNYQTVYGDIQFITYESHTEGNIGRIKMPPLPQDGDVMWVEDLDAVIDSAKEIAQRMPATDIEQRVSRIEEWILDTHSVTQSAIEKMTAK